MAAYYNEIDPYAAQWLRNLIAAGHIAPGDVDTRSILEVKPDDLKGYTQCDWFAGIAGWSYALRLAGWPDSRPVWTGSCPCQPFSAAGKQRGSDDERHLWPAFFELIRERGPGSVFGEQVAGAAGLAWLDHVCADLEGAGYAAAAAALPACCVGAHHRRERLFWVAHAGSGGVWGRDEHRQDTGASGQVSGEVRQQRVRPDVGAGSGGVCGLAAWADPEWIACSDGKARPTQPGVSPLVDGLSGGGVAVGSAVAYATPEVAGHIFSRVGVLRGAGNAIVPQVAAAFVMANMEGA